MGINAVYLYATCLDVQYAYSLPVNTLHTTCQSINFIVAKYYLFISISGPNTPQETKQRGNAATTYTLLIERLIGYQKNYS